MRIITCTGFHYSGSSAVTDLFSETNKVLAFGDYEYRFLQDPFGISDLEYSVVQNNHRLNTSDSIKQFIKYISDMKKMGYGGYDIFGDALDKCVNEFIDDIVQLKAHAWWDKDRRDRGVVFTYFDRLYSLTKRLLEHNLKSERRFSILQKIEWGYYTAISEEEFLHATRKLVDSLFQSINPDNYDYIMVDQMVPATNIDRYTRYFNDVRVICVDRDPRDIYLLVKYVVDGGVIPVNDVREYVEWFKITRKYTKCKENEKLIKRINFEDLIYKYEQTKNSLFEFVGLDLTDHIVPKKHFDPRVSINNTRLFEKYPEAKDDVAYIENNLSDYLYPYS